MEYITIDRSNNIDFDEKCNELAKKGWSPVGDIIYVERDEGLRDLFMQQWCKPEIKPI